MSSPPPQDPWLEKSRFNGMILDGVSFGILTVLTIQCFYAILTQSERGCANLKAERRTRWKLLLYIFVTFALATVGFAANAKYSEMIWIDSRNSPQGPEGLIQDAHALTTWQNRMGLISYYIMSWLMDFLLVQRCIVIWDRNILVSIAMSVVLLANVALAIVTLIMTGPSKTESILRSNFQLAYLVLSVSTNFIYTILITGRLLVIRRRLRIALVAENPIFQEEHSKIYISVASMIIESSALYSAFGVLYIVTFALHSNVENLVSLWILHVQAIAQLLIIQRVARGWAFSRDLTADFSRRRTIHGSTSLSARAMGGGLTGSQSLGMIDDSSDEPSDKSNTVPSYVV
ncbi:hypothetical protein K439DRAFT_1630386 [Ramaria rubella]|nr:hypothetical protein K439DRAFT_1630386 [Ramaria rubella]